MRADVDAASWDPAKGDRITATTDAQGRAYSTNLYVADDYPTGPWPQGDSLLIIRLTDKAPARQVSNG